MNGLGGAGLAAEHSDPLASQGGREDPSRLRRGPSSGFDVLDAALDGLYWGDNVVWWLEGAPPEPFLAAVQSSGDFDVITWVAIADDSPAPLDRHCGARLLDARRGTRLHDPRTLLRALRESCAPQKRNLILFDPLEAIAAHWSVRGASRFFATCCPSLLDANAVAYWTLRVDERTQELQRMTERISQCVLRADPERVTVVKAEGRPRAAQGHSLRYAVDQDRAVLYPTPATGHVAAALKAVREERGITQTELARLAGVTPSAISQLERGETCPSLGTLIALSVALSTPLDALVRPPATPGYRIGRRSDDPRGERRELELLLDRSDGDPRAQRVRVSSHPGGAPPSSDATRVLVTVLRGLVQVLLDEASPSLREGEVLVTHPDRVRAWRSLGLRDASVLWLELSGDRA